MAEQTPTATRDVVFISKATPGDDEFVLWLAPRLEAAGYGPHNKPARTREIRIGVVGTAEGLGYFEEAAIRLKGRVEVPPPGRTEKKNRLHLANFPGIEEAFSITYSPKEFVKYAIDARAVEDATRLLNLHEAVRKASDLYVYKVTQHLNKDERAVDVWVFVLPEAIFERCKPQAKRTGVPMLKGDFAKRQRGRSPSAEWPDRRPRLQELQFRGPRAPSAATCRPGQRAHPFLSADGA